MNQKSLSFFLFSIDCGGSLLDHELLEVGFGQGTKREKITETNIKLLHKAVREAQLSVVNRTKPKEKKVIGYFILVY